MSHNYFARIDQVLHQHPDEVLLLWPGAAHGAEALPCTGRMLLDRITVLRQALASAKVLEGQKVLLAMPVGFDLVAALLAVMGTGAVPVLPPAAATARGLLRLVRGAGIRAVVTQKRPGVFFPLAAACLGVRWIATGGIPAGSAAHWVPARDVPPDLPALITHSSGSTGEAKSIHRSHRVLAAQHAALKAAFPPWPGQRDLPLFPNILLHNLAVGTVSILPDVPGLDIRRMQPDRIVEQMINQRVQTLTGNVYYFTQLLQYLDLHPADLGHVRAVGIGGSPVPERLAHALRGYFPNANVYLIYGSSEAEPIAVRKLDGPSLDPRLGYGAGSFHPAIRWRIMEGEEVTFGGNLSYRSGEIAVSGAHVVTPAGEEWFRTGDYGYVDGQGRLFLTGRRGNGQMHRGVQHYQVEHVLQHVAGVEKAAARSLENGFAVYVTGMATESAVRQSLEQNFPAGLFTGVYFRLELPVDARHHSKIKYEQLK
jgi:acyl-CoA synthetase (AMP-forming)/AMP-acid ligase II